MFLLLIPYSTPRKSRLRLLAIVLLVRVTNTALLALSIAPVLPRKSCCSDPFAAESPRSGVPPSSREETEAALLSLLGDSKKEPVSPSPSEGGYE
jgi:hypothetical protein